MSTFEASLISGEADGTGPTRRSPRITRDDVFRAADDLLVEGNRPTIDRVRMRLGRGSPNTINDHLDAWWARLGSRLREPSGAAIPQLPERVHQALQNLWNQAQESAHEALCATLVHEQQQLSQREQALTARERELDAREDAAAGRQAALEENLQMAREQLTLVNRTVAAQEASLVERNIEHEEARARIESLEARSADLQAKIDTQAGAHVNELRCLQEQHAAAQARWLTEIDRARQAAQEAQEAHATVQRELEPLRQREAALAEWDRRLNEREYGAAERQAALEQSLQLAREQLTLVNRTISGLESSLLERNIEQEAARARIETLEASCADLKERIDAQACAHQTERDQLRGELARSQGDLKAALAVRQQLETHLQAANREPTIEQRKFRPRAGGTMGRRARP